MVGTLLVRGQAEGDRVEEHPLLAVAGAASDEAVPDGDDVAIPRRANGADHRFPQRAGMRADQPNGELDEEVWLGGGVSNPDNRVRRLKG